MAGMQRRYLGDALDFWKGCFLDVLRSTAPQGHDLQVLPMFTDKEWSNDERALYARLLHALPHALMTHAQLVKDGRNRYFSALSRPEASDVFIDPDTGIATASPKPAHVTVDEVTSFLTATNVVAVYQHRPRRASPPWLGRYRELVVVKQGTFALGYESAQVGMIFVTRAHDRAVRLTQALRRELTLVADERDLLPGRLLPFQSNGPHPKVPQRF